jgi:uncharacterized protein (TIGR00369 family)
MMNGLTGLEVNEAIRDGRLPEPTLSRVLGIRCVAVSEGEVSAELTPREDLENMGGTIHGGVLAALLDTVMGAALHTRLSASQKFATIDLKVNYLRPLSRASGMMRGGLEILFPQLSRPLPGPARETPGGCKAEAGDRGTGSEGADGMGTGH